MPQIEQWENLPKAVRRHLIDRMRDRAISLADLDQLRLWIEMPPQVPEGEWYKVSALSRSAAADHIPKRSCSEVKLRAVRPSDKPRLDLPASK